MGRGGRKFEWIECSKCCGKGQVRRVKSLENKTKNKDDASVIDRAALRSALENVGDDEDVPMHEKASEVEDGESCARPVKDNKLEEEEGAAKAKLKKKKRCGGKCKKRASKKKDKH